MKKIILIIFLFTYSTLSAKIDIKKVEPLNWWVGMKNQELQILVYGKDIATATPEINYNGITVTDIKKVENPNYLFIYVNINENTKAGSFPIVFKQGKKTVAKYNYELKQRKTSKNTHQGFDASDAVYLLMPDRFSNGNPDNDSMKGMLEKADRSNPDGRHGGDLQGVINHLDYIANTGFTTIWMNPFLENNQATYSYHGYAISDFYKVDPRMGTNDLFADLVNQAHQKGLKIIMDMIFNHCGINHWFIKDLPSPDWVNQHNEFTRSNFRGSVITDPHASNYDRNIMLTGWFDKNMPDLNQNNPILATYLIQNTIWWIEFSGIDGIRVDTQPYPFKEFMAKWAQTVTTEYPDFNIVGETWVQKIPIAAYFQKDAHNSDGYNSYIPSITDFPMFYAISSAFNESEGWTDGTAKLYYVLAQDFVYANPDKLLIFADNHDLNRYFETMGKDIKKYKMGLAFLLTTRGIPQIYYGTEILMSGQEHMGHGYIRKDFPGGWANDTVNAFLPSGRTKEQNDAYDFLSGLLKWRKNCDVIHNGKLMQFLPQDGIYVYFRYNNNKAVMVILNNNNNDAKTVKTDRFNEILKDYRTGKEIITQTNIDNLSEINIPAKSAMIIELKK